MSSLYRGGKVDSFSLDSTIEKSKLDLKLPAFHALVDSLVESLEGGEQETLVLHCLLRVLEDLERAAGAVFVPRVAGVE